MHTYVYIYVYIDVCVYIYRYVFFICLCSYVYVYIHHFSLWNMWVDGPLQVSGLYLERAAVIPSIALGSLKAMHGVLAPWGTACPVLRVPTT